MTKKKKHTTENIELDINQALAIETRLKNISIGNKIIVSKEDENIFKMAAQLIGTLLTIYEQASNCIGMSDFNGPLLKGRCSNLQIFTKFTPVARRNALIG